MASPESGTESNAGGGEAGSKRREREVTKPPTSAAGRVTSRENSVHDREDAAKLREELALLREEALTAREEAARAKAALEDGLMSQLREANENLVIATVNAQEMTETAKRANVLQEQFLAMLAHELRNPLAPIVNALAILRGIETEEPQLAWVHDVIKRQVGHLTRLLNDLLDVSRVTTGKIALQMKRIRVSEVMLQAVETSSPVIQARKQKLTLDLPAQPLSIDGDPERLAQVFSNLLNNAAKYTPEGGCIGFAAERRDEEVVLRVTDTGNGIAAEALPNVFDLFVQEGRSLARSQGGLGIGLTVVRGIVVMHGGTVQARSAGADQGSEFEVALPLARNIPKEHGLRASSLSPLPKVAYRLVQIEDNEDANASLKAVLEFMGCEVSSAFDGITGVALVLAERPQIVLCDIGLPGIDGYEVAGRLRAQMKPPLPLMIALTGYGQPEDVARALAAGFDNHAVKPVDPETLLRLIARSGVSAAIKQAVPTNG